MTLDLSALEADLNSVPTKGTGGRTCKLQVLVTEFPEAEKVIRDAISDQRRSAARVAQILTRNGLAISETTIAKHRQGNCSVCREATR